MRCCPFSAELLGLVDMNWPDRNMKARLFHLHSAAEDQSEVFTVGAQIWFQMFNQLKVTSASEAPTIKSNTVLHSICSEEHTCASVIPDPNWDPSVKLHSTMNRTSKRNLRLNRCPITGSVWPKSMVCLSDVIALFCAWRCASEQCYGQLEEVVQVPVLRHFVDLLGSWKHADSPKLW